MAWMTIAEYACHRGVERATVYYQVHKGNLHRWFDGQIDNGVADRAWRIASHLASAAPAFDRQKRRIDISALVVKHSLAKVHFEPLQERHIEREEFRPKLRDAHARSGDDP
jgi:hypothetical protein